MLKIISAERYFDTIALKNFIQMEKVNMYLCLSFAI
jgi:hypothetical protein